MPRGSCVPKLFEWRFGRAPDRVAVIDTHRTSYAALKARANVLVRQLRTLGIHRESAVGLCVERGAWSFVGALAILEGRGTYLPLDPTLPDERLAVILHDAGVKHVVVGAGYGG
jgi:non-ribosomal peptide synthetase component F